MSSELFGSALGVLTTKGFNHNASAREMLVGGALGGIGGAAFPTVAGKVAALRTARMAYNSRAAAIADEGLARVAAGENVLSVAEDVVAARNALKVDARAPMSTPLRWIAEAYSKFRYGNSVGPTLQQLLETKTPMQVIQGSGRTNRFVNWILRVS